MLQRLATLRRRQQTAFQPADVPGVQSIAAAELPQGQAQSDSTLLEKLTGRAAKKRQGFGSGSRLGITADHTRSSHHRRRAVPADADCRKLRRDTSAFRLPIIAS
jgi:hypothetical protein